MFRASIQFQLVCFDKRTHMYSVVQIFLYVVA